MGGLKWKTAFFRTQIRQYERTSRKDRGKEVKYPSTEYNRKIFVIMNSTATKKKRISQMVIKD